MGETARDELVGAGEADAIGNLDLVCTNDALRRATRQLGLLYDEALTPCGLKATQFGLLVRIEQLAEGEGPTLQTVADRLGVGISALTHALRPLVRDDLVALRTDARDKRAKRAALTALGRRRLHEAHRLWAEANRRVEVLLGMEDAKQLRMLADRLSSDGFSASFKAERPRAAEEAPEPPPADASTPVEALEPNL